jgi:hypothetical protein
MTYLLSSAGALIVDRNTWHTRADQAWGASRVWNSGSSFETDSANNLANANTWQTRANQAWGSSRVWSSGESWEAAYARVLPPTGVSTPGTITTTASVTVSDSGSVAFDFPGATYTTTRAGYFSVYGSCYVSGNNGDYTSNSLGFLRIVVNGTPAVDGPQAGLKPDNNTSDTSLSVFGVIGPYGAGVVIKLAARWADEGGAPGTRNYYNGRFVVTFVPEASYPH